MTRTIIAAGILLAIAAPAVARSLRGADDVERSLSVYDNKHLQTQTDSRMKQCLVFTAPHTLLLNDETLGGRRKKPEIYTDLLAKDLANEINGGYITWKKSERNAVDKKFRAKSTVKDCGVKGKYRNKACKNAWAAINKDGATTRRPDEINRDVNYLTNSERTHFGFMKALHRAKRRCAKLSTGKSVPQLSVGGLHVDVHGMSDKTAEEIGQHFVIGTRAMETIDNKRRKPKSGIGYDKRKSLKFRKAMAAKLNGVLKDICNDRRFSSKFAAKCTVAIGYDNGISTGYSYKKGEQDHLKFVGDWGKPRKGELRNTLSRISTEEALWDDYNSRDRAKPFGCAVQVELSTQFRRSLYNKDGSKTALGSKFVPKLARGFAGALKAAGCT